MRRGRLAGSASSGRVLALAARDRDELERLEGVIA
jgi:hypothetical protein